MTTAADIVSEARKWVGTPFVHQGRTLGVGVDCAGLVIGVAHGLGLSDFDYLPYGRQPEGQLLRQMLEAHLQHAPSSADGDIMLMRFSRDPQHLAIVAGDNIIHAWESARECTEHRMDDRWRRRIVSVYRFPGLD